MFERDGHVCVFCGEPAVDAHHILDRKLWPDGGYYLNNGASVCAAHHLECEQTTISVEQVRKKCEIIDPIVPPHLSTDVTYDKWGNEILPNGTRLRGEMFDQEGVQKVLSKGGVLSLFTPYVKYPSTFHLPWSEGVQNDDHIMPSTERFEGSHVVVTEKMDGENTSLYSDHIHARSLDSANHPSRNWVKNHWATVRTSIPDGWRICGENMYAQHSIAYSNLETYFLVFSIWNEKNECLSWNETLEWVDMLELSTVPILYEGEYNEKKIKQLWNEMDPMFHEGYVVRVADSFHYSEFAECVGKFVRKGHVQTDEHWMKGPMTLNRIREE